MKEDVTIPRFQQPLDLLWHVWSTVLESQSWKECITETQLEIAGHSVN